MSEDAPTYHAFTGREETSDALKRLIERFERGEVTCAALRLFNADGTFEDIAVGGTDEERVAALASLREAQRRQH